MHLSYMKQIYHDGQQTRNDVLRNFEKWIQQYILHLERLVQIFLKQQSIIHEIMIWIASPKTN